MILEIVTPEAVIFHSEVISVAVPGVNGSFQMLKDHAPIVSLLDKGFVKIKGSNIELLKDYSDKFSKNKDEYLLEIKGGTVEMNNNKIIVLAD
jgi:F-type H+-transporting ATPase subunit epsilon